MMGRMLTVIVIITVGRCADGALGDTPGEFKVEHVKIVVKSKGNLTKLL